MEIKKTHDNAGFLEIISLLCISLTRTLYDCSGHLLSAEHGVESY